MTAVVLQTQALTKKFNDVTAVNGLNLSVGKGEMYTLVGPDGAGKTTTIRLLCGILSPTQGGGQILGLDIVKDRELIKPQIGYLSQRFSLYGDLTIDENIEFFAEIHGVSDYKARRDELLETTRLTPFRKRLAERLSGGMKQKLALACTMIHTPKIIFLDEPTTGVDPVSRRDFWILLSNILKRGTTVIMTTPYLDEAERGSRVAFLNHGELMIVDTPKAVKSKMKGFIWEIQCSDLNQSKGILVKMRGVSEVQTFGDRLNVITPNQDDGQKIEAVLKRKGLTEIHVRPIPPKLENVFISFIKQENVGI